MDLDKRLSPSYNKRVSLTWIAFIFVAVALTGVAPVASAQGIPAPTLAPAFSTSPATTPEPKTEGAKINTNGILINAANMLRDNEKQTAELEGNVQIVFQGQHIRADKARVYFRSRKVELYGNVEIMDAKNTIVGERVFLDYETNTGVIFEGFVQSGAVMFSGSVLQKTADSEYLVSSADYTACVNCPAAWSFSGTTVRAELGGYAYIKNAILKFGPVPVFWFPYLVVPLKSDRQSGVLTPTFESSDSGGIALSLPYFWAVSESSDVTVEVKDYSKRGTKLLGEYRYVLDENSRGFLNVGSIYDRVFADDPRVNHYRSVDQKNQTIARWYARYEHYQVMPDEGVARAQVNLASDLQYAKDFPIETLNHGDAAMENRVSYTKNTRDQHFSVDTDYYVNLLQGDPLGGNDDAVHRIPELRFSQTQGNIGNSNFIYSFDANLVNFTRAGNAYDDMTLNNDQKYPTNSCDTPNWQSKDSLCYRIYDGTYDPSIDLIRTGQRLDLRPSVYYPIELVNGVSVVPKLSYRETHYNFGVDSEPSASRRQLRAEISGLMKFSRIYGDLIDPKASRYKHEIVPEITYTRLPWLAQDSHPFFGSAKLDEFNYTSQDGISDLDIANDYGVQFDYNDRVYDRNLMTIAVTNKITEKRWVSDRPVYRQIGYLKFAQSYDATQENRGNANEAWSDINATLDVRMDGFQTYSTFNYFPYQSVTNVASNVRVLNKKGHFAQVRFNRKYQITPGEEVVASSRQEDYTISAGYISRYINLMGKFVYDANLAEGSAGSEIKSWAYVAQFKPPGDCLSITFIQEQITGGGRNLNISFDFTFDGRPKPQLPPETLDLYGL